MNRIEPRHLIFPIICFFSLNLAFITFKNSFSINNRMLTDSKDESIHPSRISDFFPSSIRKWEQYIIQASEQYSFDPDLIASVMLQESGGNPGAFSVSGAVGLMQVMPSDGPAAAFQCKNGSCFSDRPTIEDLINPEFNVHFGAALLSEYVSKYGSTREGLKNYGPMDVGYRYADTVIEIYEKSKLQKHITEY